MENIIYSVPEAHLIADSQPRDSVEAFVSDKSYRVLLRRWAATWVDFAMLFMVFVAGELLLGSELYQKTIPFWIVLAILYFPILEGLTGYSVGKFIFRVRVIDKNGNIPGLWKAIVRTALRFIEVNPILLGGIPAGIVFLVTKKGQRIGDMLAGTHVISCKDYKHLKTIT